MLHSWLELVFLAKGSDMALKTPKTNAKPGVDSVMLDAPWKHVAQPGFTTTAQAYR